MTAVVMGSYYDLGRGDRTPKHPKTIWRLSLQPNGRFAEKRGGSWTFIQGPVARRFDLGPKTGRQTEA
jgi:hypothetical protein